MAAKKPKATQPVKSNKTAPSKRTSARSSQPIKAPIVSDRATSEHPAVRLKRSYIITAVIVLVLAGLLIAGRSLFVAAMVNGQPITRVAVVHELERQGGKQALNSLITKTLIQQEADRKNISVSQKEIDDQVNQIQANLKKQGQTLDQVLSMQGMTKTDLIDQVRLNKLIEKMVGKDIKVSDKEVTDYLDKNKDFIPAGTSDADAKKQAQQQVYQQKLNAKVRPWLDQLQKNAKLSCFVDYCAQ